MAAVSILVTVPLVLPAYLAVFCTSDVSGQPDCLLSFISTCDVRTDGVPCRSSFLINVDLHDASILECVLDMDTRSASDGEVSHLELRLFAAQACDESDRSMETFFQPKREREEIRGSSSVERVDGLDVEADYARTVCLRTSARIERTQLDFAQHMYGSVSQDATYVVFCYPCKKSGGQVDDESVCPLNEYGLSPLLLLCLYGGLAFFDQDYRVVELKAFRWDSEDHCIPERFLQFDEGVQVRGDAKLFQKRDQFHRWHRLPRCQHLEYEGYTHFTWSMPGELEVQGTQEASTRAGEFGLCIVRLSSDAQPSAFEFESDGPPNAFFPIKRGMIEWGCHCNAPKEIQDLVLDMLRQEPSERPCIAEVCRRLDRATKIGGQEMQVPPLCECEGAWSLLVCAFCCPYLVKPSAP